MKGLPRPEAAAEAASRHQCAKMKLRTFSDTSERGSPFHSLGSVHILTSGPKAQASDAKAR